jgi:hypothetical protein
MWLRRLNLGLETVARNSFHAVGLPRVPLGEEARCDAEPVSRSSAVATFTRMLAGFLLWMRSLPTGVVFTRLRPGAAHRWAGVRPRTKPGGRVVARASRGGAVYR